MTNMFYIYTDVHMHLFICTSTYGMYSLAGLPITLIHDILFIF